MNTKGAFATLTSGKKDIVIACTIDHETYMNLSFSICTAVK